MKIISALYFLVLTIPISAQTLTPIKDFGANPGNLKMYLYSPRTLNESVKTPLVVVLHGCLQSAGSVSKQSGWNKLADAYGFRVLYPQQRTVNNPIKCFCWYNRNDIEKGKGENFSIKQMIEYVKKNYKVDSDSVFVTGLSAGAAMAVTLMADYPQTFNAGAIFAGGPYKVAVNLPTAMLAMYGWRIKRPENWGNLVREQNPDYTGRFPRMIIYHGNMDVVVNKRNGAQLMKQWTNLHHIGTVPSEVIRRFAGAKAIEKRIYRNADGEAVVIYYKVKHLGHALLVDPGKCQFNGGKLGLFSADKNYFSTYWTAVDFGLIHPLEITGKKVVNKLEKNLTYTIPSKASGSFKWSYPKDCQVIDNKGFNTITLNWGNRPGNIDVVEIISKKCQLKYPTILVRLVE